MAYSFGDGFDHYTANTDPLAGYWDGGSTSGNPTFVTGRFPGGQCVRIAIIINGSHIKSSGQNDAVHHINVAFRNNSSISGTNATLYFQLSDGATNQCCVVFRSDGAILLTSATPAGTTLATYTGAATAINVWFAFEFEVIIHPTAGRFRVRKNGNTSDDFDSGAVLNTRPGTNSYANKITLGSANSPSATLDFDDFLWRSDASSVTWAGDIRCYTRMPASDASVQFARSQSVVPVTPFVAGGSTAISNVTPRYSAFTAPCDGTLGTVSLSMATGYTGNMKCTLFASSGTAPTTIIASATPISNPVAGPNTFIFPSPPALTKGTQYYLGWTSDTSLGTWSNSPSSSGLSYGGSLAYASFPTPSPPTNPGVAPVFTANITTTNNASFVNDAQQDGTTSYVYDSVVGHGDLYNLAPLANSPSSILMVTTLGFMEKSDAGARGAAMQLRSGANLIASTTWNPADKSAGTTLSNGNLTAALGGQNGVRGVFGQNAGKYYFEITATAIGSNTAIGLANPSCNIDILGIGGAGAVNVVDTGFAYMNNSGTSVSIGAIANGAIICIAVDLTNQLIWFKNGVAGNWNGTAGFSPGGTGGLAFTAALGGAGGTLLYPVVSSYSGGANFTANFGATAFAGTVPAGFSSGFGAQSGGTTVQSTATLLSTSFTYLYRNDVLNPNGNIPWTAAAVDALQFGPLVTS